MKYDAFDPKKEIEKLEEKKACADDVTERLEALKKGVEKIDAAVEEFGKQSKSLSEEHASFLDYYNTKSSMLACTIKDFKTECGKDADDVINEKVKDYNTAIEQLMSELATLKSVRVDQEAEVSRKQRMADQAVTDFDELTAVVKSAQDTLASLGDLRPMTIAGDSAQEVPRNFLQLHGQFKPLWLNKPRTDPVAISEIGDLTTEDLRTRLNGLLKCVLGAQEELALAKTALKKTNDSIAAKTLELDGLKSKRADNLSIWFDEQTFTADSC